jgi:hypothetical protein
MPSKEQRLQPTPLPSLACCQELELKQFCAEAQKIGVFSSSAIWGTKTGPGEKALPPCCVECIPK